MHQPTFLASLVDLGLPQFTIIYHIPCCAIVSGFSEDSTHVSSFFNPSRPIGTAETTGEWGAGPGLNDVRAMASTGGARGMYGLSPRVPLPTSNRTMSKKAKRTF